MCGSVTRSAPITLTGLDHLKRLFKPAQEVGYGVKVPFFLDLCKKYQAGLRSLCGIVAFMQHSFIDVIETMSLRWNPVRRILT